MGPRTPLGGGSSPLAAAFSRAAGYCTEKSEGHWAGLGAQRGVAGPRFGRRTVAEYGGGHPHLPGSVRHGLRGRQREGQRGNVCTAVFSSPLVGWISEKCCGRGTSTLAAAQVADCEAGSGWGGSLSYVAGERSQYSRTCPAAYVYGSAAGKGGVGGNLLRTVSFGLWEGGHGGTCYRQRMSRTARPAGPPGPCNAMPSALKDRSREESACEKSAALIRRPAQGREQP